MRVAEATVHNRAASAEILARGLADTSDEVRRAAFMAIAMTPDASLGSKLLDAAKRTSNWQDLPLYCTALGRIQ